MPLMGNGKKGIFILSESPSEAEDKAGKPLSGDSGLYLKRALKFHNIDIEEDCWYTNSVRCKVPEKTDALKFVSKCHASIQKMLTDCQPKKIILLGTVAIASYYAEFPEVTKSIPANRGLAFWEPRFNCYVFPIMHPSTYCNSKDQSLVAGAKRDFNNAIAHNEPPPNIPKPTVQRLVTVDAVLEYLQWLLDTKPHFAFDYEATGLKPQLKGHKAVSVGICTAAGAVAFPLQHRHWKGSEQRKIEKLWKLVLADRKIKKIVQAMNMEWVWSEVQFGPCNGIIWDTQLGSHVLDNREGGFFGLKFQAFLRWGVRDYSKDMDKYIRAAKGEHFNRMEYAPLGSMLTYNGLDALYTYHIWEKQQTEFRGNELAAYRFFHRGLLIMGEMHMNGICMDIKYYTNQIKILEKEAKELHDQIMLLPEVTQFKQMFKRELSITSTDDLRDLFFKQLKITSVKKTSTDLESVDKEVVDSIDHPIARRILKIRKLDKIRSTYLEGFLREAAQDKIYPVFQLHKVISFRSSSAMPNFQNMSKRDKRAKKITRSGLIPSIGCVIGEGDFSGAEVCMSAAYHKDRNFIKYLLDKTTDMHRDCAKDIWLLREIWDTVSMDIQGAIRQNMKADWTFAEFYGARWKKCAIALWAKKAIKLFPDGTTLEDNLITQGIKTEAAFFKHVENFENKFWNVMFPEYKAWKDKVVRDYIRDGYVETYFGFRFKGIMNEREVCNYPVQGSSFHMLLYVAYELSAELKRRAMKTKLIGQIHDSIIADIPLNEVCTYAKVLKGIMGTLQDKFPWLCVPIKIEFEISYPREEGGSFAVLEPVDMDVIEVADDYNDIIYVKTLDINGEQVKNSTRILKEAA